RRAAPATGARRQPALARLYRQQKQAVRVRGRRALFVVLACVLVNGRSLLPGFIHDDHRIIEQNGLTEGPGRRPEILTSGYWSTSDARVPNLYRPLTIFSFALNRWAHGLRPLGCRLVDLLLHAGCALLVLQLAARLFPTAAAGSAGFDRALVAGLVFAVHPVHTEAVGERVGVAAARG